MNVTTSLADREMLWRPSPGHFWTMDRVARALAAHALSAPVGTRSFSGVSTDTRAVAGGELFVALVGERFDAHDFLRQAVDAGAAAVVVSRAEQAAGLGVPAYIVADTTRALGALATWRRRVWGAGRFVVGVTGTNGKTSTKDLLAAALGARLEVSATHGNLNNQIGVPLTLLAVSDHSDVAIVEMGTNSPGEIAQLRAIAEPEIAVLTSVAEGHLELLGSVEGVMNEKVSIFAGAALAVHPASQPEIGERARGLARRVVSAGLGEGDVAATRWGLRADGSGWLELDGVEVSVPLRGLHTLRNAMLALAVAREAGLSTEDAGRGIASMQAGAMRLETIVLGTRQQPGGGAGNDPREIVLINDAYNANPGSAIAAIEYLSSLQVTGSRVLILGGMRELGASAAALHDRVAKAALASNADLIAGIGDFESAFARVAHGDARLVTADDVDTLWIRLRDRMPRPATVLLKASRGVRLERIVPYISDWAET